MIWVEGKIVRGPEYSIAGLLVLKRVELFVKFLGIHSSSRRSAIAHVEFCIAGLLHPLEIHGASPFFTSSFILISWRRNTKFRTSWGNSRILNVEKGWVFCSSWNCRRFHAEFRLMKTRKDVKKEFFSFSWVVCSGIRLDSGTLLVSPLHLLGIHFSAGGLRPTNFRSPIAHFDGFVFTTLLKKFTKQPFRMMFLAFLSCNSCCDLFTI